MLLPCSRSFNGFSSHWEQNPKIPYLPCRQTPSPPALPLAHFTAHPPACWSSNVPSVLLPQDMCTCCFLSRTFLPDTRTLHSFTLFLYLLKAVISVKPSPPRCNALHHLTCLFSVSSLEGQAHKDRNFVVSSAHTQWVCDKYLLAT